MLPLQAEAIARHGVLQGKSAIIFAPTSSGKTLIAELAALKQIEARRRVIYLVPTKALAEERGHEFRARFGAVGARVVVATRDRPDTDPLIARGEWDLMVAIYEKVRAHLVTHPALLADVGLVVADELQMIGELGRGDTVELILTKMTRAPYRGVQFLGLSAVLSDAARIGAWLGCDVLTWRTRPVELREGVLTVDDGVFRFHGVNAGSAGEESLIDPSHFPRDLETSDPALLLLTVAEQLALRGESVLIFAPTKRLTREWALALAGRLPLDPAANALEQLEAIECSQGRDALAQVLRSGVAFHNADLPAPLRIAVERAYDRGEVRVLVSTSTLAQGINLTGRNVLIAPQQVETDRWTGELANGPLTRSRFHNMGGRAGRFGREADFGRAILIARSRDEADRLAGHYIGRSPEELRPTLSETDLAPLILDLIAGGVATRPRAIEEFLLGTYTGLTLWQALPPAAWHDAWLPILENLEAARLVRRDGDGDLSASGLGREVARAGISLKSARQMDQWLSQIQGEPSPLEVIWSCCRSDDGAEFPLPLWRAERQSHRLLEQMRCALTELGGPSHPISEKWLAPSDGVTPGDLCAVKKALLLWAWLGDAPTADIEQQFGVQAGMIENFAAHVAWLLETLAALATSLGHPDPRTAAWRRLTRRLPQGLPAGGEGWAGAHVIGFGRSHARALVAQGFEKPGDLAGADCETLSRIIPRTLGERLLGTGPTSPMRPSGPMNSSPLPQSIIPHVNRDTGTVRWLGKTVRLTAKPAALLALLAERAPEAVSYREIEDTVWPPGEAAERQQISAHMRRIVKSLSTVDARRASELIEVRLGQGLRLCI